MALDGQERGVAAPSFAANKAYSSPSDIQAMAMAAVFEIRAGVPTLNGLRKSADTQIPFNCETACVQIARFVSGIISRAT
jgi:hypothetical protein